MTIPYDELPLDGDNHVERRETRVIVLSEAQINAIAERVEDRFYERIGKTVIEKVTWAIGLGTLALLVWLGGKGWLK